MTIPKRMCAVRLIGHGGIEKLVYGDDVPTPVPADDEVLIRVVAAGMNNTDINTRIGWYSKEATTGTTTQGARDGTDVKVGGMGDWKVGLSFPRIQGADIIGHIVGVGKSVDSERIGQRVTCDPYVLESDDQEGWRNSGFLGADYDGGFAQFVTVPTRNVYSISERVALTDAALATLPCSGGTAMNMLLMAHVGPGDIMLVTGASGGVGTFLIQLGHHLGAEVVAIASKSKFEQLSALSPKAIIDRNASDHVSEILVATNGRKITVIADVVGGDRFTDYLSLLGPGGRYVTAGAIAGPIVSLDLRTLYLKSLEFYGSSAYRRDTFPKLLEIVEQGGIDPLVASIWQLSEIREAQLAFLDKKHIGSLVLIPPPVEE